MTPSRRRRRWSKVPAAAGVLFLLGAGAGSCGERESYPAGPHGEEGRGGSAEPPGGRSGGASSESEERASPEPAGSDALSVARAPGEGGALPPLEFVLKPHAVEETWRLTMRQRGRPPQARFELTAASHAEDDGAVLKHLHRVDSRVRLEQPQVLFDAPVSEPPPGLLVQHRTDRHGRLVSDVEVVNPGDAPLPWLEKIVARFLRLDPPVGAFGPLRTGDRLRYSRQELLHRSPAPTAVDAGDPPAVREDAPAPAPGESLPVRLRLEAVLDRVEDRGDLGLVAVFPVSGTITPGMAARSRNPPGTPGERQAIGTVQGEVAFSVDQGRVVARSWQLTLPDWPADGGIPRGTQGARDGQDEASGPSAVDDEGGPAFDQILVGTPFVPPAPRPGRGTTGPGPP